MAVKPSCGMGLCLHCGNPYLRTRWWSKYCSDYCKKQRWSMNKRVGK